MRQKREKRERENKERDERERVSEWMGGVMRAK